MKGYLFLMEIVLAIATILGGITALWFFWDKFSHRRTYKQHFPKTDDEFYNYYAEQIASAKDEIWITSDGFNMDNPRSRQFAEVMTKAFRSSLSNNVQVIRFQVVETMHINWIDELIKLKSEYPENFKVYVNEHIKSVPNVCAIDADSKKCVGERMEHATGIFGQGSQAKTYSFVHKDNEYAQATRDIVKGLIDHSSTKEYSLNVLRRWKNKLMDQRTKDLQAWVSENPKNSNLKCSGIFDEEVITNFIQQARGIK